MRHISMFLTSSKHPLGYIQVVCREDYKEELESLGWVDCSSKLTEEEVQEEISNTLDIPVDPDKGFGDPGSFEWHRTQILSFDDKDNLEGYVKGLTGIDIDKRGKLDTVKKKAIEALEEWQKQQVQS